MRVGSHRMREPMVRILQLMVSIGVPPGTYESGLVQLA